jgi:hypothetical protein
MTEWRNEIVGGRFHGQVIQAGIVEELVVNLGAAAAETSVAPWAAWPDRPSLTPGLMDLMAAQQRATVSLPYTLLKVKQPDLIDVYVRQTVLSAAPDRMPEPERRSSAELATAKPVDAVERPMTVSDALNSKQHLVIMGEQGAGKSTLGHMYVQRLAKLWLDTGDDSPPPLAEPVLPLRIPARALIGNEPWSVRLAAGAKEMVGRFLNRSLDHDVFGGRALRARWLVFVDGLDEILESEVRRKVIESIAHQVRRTNSHRLVITTRPLGWQELQPLAGLVDTYQIRPFDTAELEEFARGWFRKQDPINGSRRVREFLDEARDSRLRDLFRNPLLATVAAIHKTRQPDQPLPNNRADLYQQFMRYLLAEGASGRSTAVELRRSIQDRPARRRLVDWMAERRTAIIAMLAVHRLNTEDSLFEAACAWVEEHQDVIDTAAYLPGEWREDLRELLVDSGVFARADENLRFLHHTFAEFLAARHSATEIPADFPDLDTWITRGQQPASEAFALFTFVLWGRRPGNDIGMVVRRLLSIGADAVLLSGRLLAEGVTVPRELTASVVSRVVDLMLARGGADVRGDSDDALRRVLAALGSHTLGEAVIGRLRTLRDGADIAMATRIRCGIALGHLIEPAESLDWLERLAHGADLPALRLIVRGMAELPPDGVDRAERLLVGIGGRAGQDYVLTMEVATLLRDIDRAKAGGPLIDGLVRRLRSDPGVTRYLGTVPSHPTDSSQPTRVTDRQDERRPSWVDLARLAEDAGCLDDAVWAARRMLDLPDADWELQEAVQTLLRLRGADSVAEIMAAVQHRKPEDAIDVAKALYESGQPGAARQLVRTLLADGHVTDGWFADGVRLVCDIDPACQQEFRHMLDELPAVVLGHDPDLIRILDSADARRLAETVLADPALEPSAFVDVAEIMLGGADAEIAKRLVSVTLERGPRCWARVAALLYGAGFADQCAVLVDRLLDSRADVAMLAETTEELLERGARDMAVRTLEAALQRADHGTAQDCARLATALHGVGRVDQAVDLARRAFVMSISCGLVTWPETETWLRVGGAGCAGDIVVETVKHDAGVNDRMKIASTLMDEGLLDAAVTLWLDVVRHHGDVIEKGITAASRLTRCGYRARTIAVIEQALAEDHLTATARTNLRSLLAWVTFQCPNATEDDIGRAAQ